MTTTTHTPRPRYAGAPLDNEKLAREEYRQGNTVLESLPPVVTFAVTTFCNNMIPCLICDRNVRQRISDRECNERVIRAMEPLIKTAKVLLLHCGGEAMFSKHFDTLVRAVEPPTRVSFATNAMLMGRRRAELMLERDVMTKIVVSMDAATPELYRVMRPSSAFSTVTGNVRYYVQCAKARGRKDARVELNMTICKTNLNDIPTLVDLACELGARSVSYGRLNPGLDYTAKTVDDGDWNYYDQSHFDPSASDQKILEAYERAKASGIEMTFSGTPFIGPGASSVCPSIVRDLQGIAPFAESKEDEWSSPRHKALQAPPCFKPWREICVQPDGEIRLCYFHDYPRCSLGNVLDGDFMNIWNSPRIVAERESFLANGVSLESCAQSPSVCVHRGRT